MEALENFKVVRKGKIRKKIERRKEKRGYLRGGNILYK